MINIREFLGLGYYTSDLDQFLKEFDKTHPKLSTSQRKEVDKYDRIFEMRDDPNYHATKPSFWAHLE